MKLLSLLVVFFAFTGAKAQTTLGYTMGQLRSVYDIGSGVLTKWQIQKAGTGQTYVSYENANIGTSIASYFSLAPGALEPVITQVKVIGATQTSLNEFTTECNKNFRRLDTGLWAGPDNYFLVTVATRGPVVVMTYTVLGK